MIKEGNNSWWNQSGSLWKVQLRHKLTPLTQIFTFVKSVHLQSARAPDTQTLALQVCLELWRVFLFSLNWEDKTLFHTYISCAYGVGGYCTCLEKVQYHMAKQMTNDYPHSHSHLQTIKSYQSAYCAFIWTVEGIWERLERTQTGKERLHCTTKSPWSGGQHTGKSNVKKSTSLKPVKLVRSRVPNIANTCEQLVSHLSLNASKMTSLSS